jgi:hypothetical protein
MAGRSKYTLRIGVALGAGAGVLSLLGVLLTGLSGVTRGVFTLLEVVLGSDVAALDLQDLGGMGLLVGCSALYGLAGGMAMARTQTLRAGAVAGLISGVVAGLIGGVGILITALADPSGWQTALGGDVDSEVILSTALLLGGIGLVLNAIFGVSVGTLGGLLRRKGKS